MIQRHRIYFLSRFPPIVMSCKTIFQYHNHIPCIVTVTVKNNQITTRSLYYSHYLFKLFHFSSVQFSHSVMSNSLRLNELQHARPPCPSPTPRVYANSCPKVSDAIHPSHPLSSPFPPAPRAGSLLLCTGFPQLKRVEVSLHSNAWASHWGGFSHCQTQVLSTWASVVQVCLLVVAACRLEPRIELVFLILAGRFLSTESPGKSCTILLQTPLPTY